MRRLRGIPLVLILAVWLAGAGLVAVAFADPMRFWTPDAASIAQSVEREGDGINVLSCARIHGGADDGDAWRCEVEIDPHSGPEHGFALVLDDEGCWRGTRHDLFAKRTPPLAGVDPMNGCVEALDHLWP